MAEVQRRYRVADMMITIHSILRDSYKRRSLALDLVIFSSSVLIAALAVKGGEKGYSETRSPAGNPDSLQAIVFVTWIVDVTTRP